MKYDIHITPGPQARASSARDHDHQRVLHVRVWSPTIVSLFLLHLLIVEG